MESTAHQKASRDTPSLGGILGRDLVVQDQGLTRLAVMVGEVFERLTSADDQRGQVGFTA